MTLMTLGLIVYCIIDVAFESAVPKLVRERSTGIHKRLGGTPLRAWIFLVAKTLSASSDRPHGGSPDPGCGVDLI